MRNKSEESEVVEDDGDETESGNEVVRGDNDNGGGTLYSSDNECMDLTFNRGPDGGRRGVHHGGQRSAFFIRARVDQVIFPDDECLETRVATTEDEVLEGSGITAGFGLALRSMVRNGDQIGQVVQLRHIRCTLLGHSSPHRQELEALDVEPLDEWSPAQEPQCEMRILLLAARRDNAPRGDGHCKDSFESRWRWETEPFDLWGARIFEGEPNSDEFEAWCDEPEEKVGGRAFH